MGNGLGRDAGGPDSSMIVAARASVIVARKPARVPTGAVA